MSANGRMRHGAGVGLVLLAGACGSRSALLDDLPPEPDFPVYDGSVAVDAGRDAERDAAPDVAEDAAPDVVADVGVPRIDAGPDADPEDFAPVVFGQTANTLYKLDLDTQRIGIVANFNGCNGSVLDIAIDETSQMYGVAQGGISIGVTRLYRIDKKTGDCTLIGPRGNYPNSLAFAPKGILSADSEVMVGFNGANYIAIDTVNGVVTTLRSGALPGALESSGDLVVLTDGRGFVTVRGTSQEAACTQHDCLIEFDGRTGAFVRNWGDVGYPEVYGLTYWGNVLYGFSGIGAVFRLDFGRTAVVSQRLPFPEQPTFFGAGSISIAPTGP